ncbi:3'-5' exoribonuclease YhaM family protein [Terriglobus saanensis]|uniref:Metal dependent phosphohydrolase n=1 Tax=Terriglobus saanensis (strain ATCC BAA-1853 / DSM 23119 / SP1PR4) TaxID=401053 RepID=E8V4M8_TERSS|nr:HD domain-containing protein [Terriglobus saanensis]ADV81432.1 metal dependent phosphohydrolase [Terriglobus saanensis SP1PR4]
MKDFYIADAAKHENAHITSYFALASISARDKKGGGGQYLALTLADKTGSFEARMWEDFADALNTCSSGCYVKVQGRIDKYQGRYQITLSKMRSAAESEIDTADFQPTTQYDIAALSTELDTFVASFTNHHLQALVRSFLDDPDLGPAFRTAPAAKMLHHAWIGGLLEHVVFLLRLAERIAPQYPEVDRDLLMTGAILHDFGKVRELAWKTSFSYTAEGQLLGHITIVIGMLRDKIRLLPEFPDRLRILVEHLILSHHGRFEFGSPKLPMTPEAIVFSAIDDLEAKMQNIRAEFQKALEGGKAPDEVTDFSRSMERALLNSKAYLAGE